MALAAGARSSRGTTQRRQGGSEGRVSWESPNAARSLTHNQDGAETRFAPRAVRVPAAFGWARSAAHLNPSLASTPIRSKENASKGDSTSAARSYEPPLPIGVHSSGLRSMCPMCQRPEGPVRCTKKPMERSSTAIRLVGRHPGWARARAACATVDARRAPRACDQAAPWSLQRHRRRLRGPQPQGLIRST